MTQMELSTNADEADHAGPTAGNTKTIPLSGNGDGDVFLLSNIESNGDYKCEKITEEFYEEQSISEGTPSDHFDSSSDGSIDDYLEKKEGKVILSSDTEDEMVKESTPTTETNGNDEVIIGADGLRIRGGEVQILIPRNSQLPIPEAPPGATMNESQSMVEKVEGEEEVPSIGKYFWEKSNSWSSAITKRLYSVADNNKSISSGDDASEDSSLENVIVNSKTNGVSDDDTKSIEFRGRISFFSKSSCRDCTAVRTLLREKNLRYVEINIDVFPAREKELIERTGCSAVPQIFLNQKLFGGLVMLNSLRNSGLLEEKLKELLSSECPNAAPAVPVYGFDDPEDELMDEMVGVVKVLRQNLPIQDRLMKMKMVKNCFSGADMVDTILKYYAGLDRFEALEIGKQLARKHFIHHVFGENEFEDGSHYYRFLEHEPFILKCFNYQVSTKESEPKAASFISQRLTKLMSAILESYASDDRQYLNYTAISNSEEFRRYVNLVQDLQRVNLLSLSEDEKQAFFLNLFNAMVIHAVIKIGNPVGVVARRSFNSDFLYIIGGEPYSLNAIRNGILRSNQRAPYSLVKPFGAGDKRLELALKEVNPLIHFGLCDGTRSSPVVRFFTPHGVHSELRNATREFFRSSGIEVDLEKRTVYLTRIITWYNVDFGEEKDMLQWMIKYLDATKAGLLTHLLSDDGPVNIVYQDYDWSLNS